MSASDYLELSLANHIFTGTVTFANPAILLIGLFTTMPEEDGTGGVEPAADEYARVAYGPGEAFWTVATDGSGEVTNADYIVFPDPTGDDWGTILGVGIYDESGNLLFAELLGTPKVVLGGDNPAPEFRPGSIVLTIS